MFRLVLSCLFLAAAGLILSGRVHAQATGLKPGLVEEEEAAQAGEEVVVPPRVTTLEVTPLIVPPPPPKKRFREDDPYAALGIDLGGLIAYPTLRAGAVYTDNVAQSHSDRQSDIGVRLRPSLRAESEWVRHAFNANGTGDFTFYRDEPDYNTMSAEASARLRVDIRRTTDATLEASYFLTQDSAGQSDVPDDAVGNRTDQTYTLAAGLTHRMGRLETRLKTGITWQTYGDVELAGGGEENNSDRDYYQPEIVLRAGYEFSPAFAPYVEAAYRPRYYDVTPDASGVDRNSNGYSVGLGVIFEPSPIWSGDLALIYLIRDYDDPSLDTLETVGLDGNVVWRPSELTEVTFTAGTSIGETSLEGSSGSLNYDADLDVSHELRENLIASAGAGIGIEDFQGVDLNELTLNARLGLIWRLSRFFALTGDYDFEWFDSTAAGSDFHEHRVTAGVEVRR